MPASVKMRWVFCTSKPTAVEALHGVEDCLGCDGVRTVVSRTNAG